MKPARDSIYLVNKTKIVPKMHTWAANNISFNNTNENYLCITKTHSSSGC